MDKHKVSMPDLYFFLGWHGIHIRCSTVTAIIKTFRTICKNGISFDNKCPLCGRKLYVCIDCDSYEDPACRSVFHYCKCGGGISYIYDYRLWSSPATTPEGHQQFRISYFGKPRKRDPDYKFTQGDRVVTSIGEGVVVDYYGGEGLVRVTLANGREIIPGDRHRMAATDFVESELIMLERIDECRHE